MQKTLKEKYIAWTESKYYAPLLLVISMFATLLNCEGIAACALVTVISITLLSSSDMHSTLLPFLLTCILAGSGVSDYYDFGRYVIAALPLFFTSIVLNIIWYKKKLTLGASFLPLLAVMLALFLGGITERSLEEYFRPGSILHLLMLGPGMLALYLLLRVLWFGCDLKKLSRSLSLSMLQSSIYCMFVVLFISLFQSELLTGTAGLAQFLNLASSFLVLCIPFAFERALQNNLYTVFALSICAATVLSGSRTGIVFGGIITLICYIWLIVRAPRRRALNTFVLFFLIVVGFAAFQYIGADKNADPSNFLFISPGETRITLISRSVSDFLSSPIFGQGICYSGNSNAFNPLPMAMHWYHNLFAQIIGSMGLVGVAAYTYLFIERIKILRSENSAFAQCSLICYIALLLCSITEPGIFSPIPNSVITMFFFVILEIKKESKKQCLTKSPNM
jgi:hypothetical protein